MDIKTVPLQDVSGIIKPAYIDASQLSVKQISVLEELTEQNAAQTIQKCIHCGAEYQPDDKSIGICSECETKGIQLFFSLLSS